jgi:UDP-N-acetylglucosamine--N-acetylmuramyl-(pentapeptide) pyrophosphoryl-undecaprenol N-acetylglucosamine transferase
MTTHSTTLTIMIMAGGTGGHVFPALAVAEALRSSNVSANVNVEWLGTARGIENTLVPAANISLNHIRVEGVRGRGVLGLLKAPFLIVLAIVQALKIFHRLKPDLVIGFGGFVSGPGGIAAKMLRKPLVIHEQNAVAGTTNRLLARLANRVLVGFDKTFFAGDLKTTLVGNPVRSAIADMETSDIRYGVRAEKNEPLHLLILGGSLGAKAINELLPKVLAEFSENNRPQVWHQCGKNHLETTTELYQQQVTANVEAFVETFIEDMAAAYAWADLVVCRAGALTVSELMAAGVASVLIPLPTAIDDHQTFNAAILSRAHAGIAIAQKDATTENLGSLLTRLLNREKLLVMAKNARQLALPSAAENVATLCVELCADLRLEKLSG